MASKCWCCVNPEEESFHHLFFRSYAAKKVWSYFLSCAGWIKVNADAASRGNPGRSSIGFVLKNEYGDVVYAYGKEIQEGTNTEAEAKVVGDALKYCIEQDYVLIDLHTDSVLLHNVISRKWAVPWSIAVYVEEIKELKARANVTVSHTHREGNRLANHLANYALDVGHIEYHYFGDLDIQGRRIVNNDKLQCPYLRIRVVRR
ncbi:uncharacterized protein [Nicotiana tomentosiformis]|uniref:uncharacterized protein n=1 Tax=Nicotiana tomentosiformis TaxID=4098 RepID=UPI00388CBE6F